MISIIIFAAVILNIQLILVCGQISGSTKCTSSSLTTCTYSQIRCPPNYYFNGKFCLPVQTAVAVPTQPSSPPQIQPIFPPQIQPSLPPQLQPNLPPQIQPVLPPQIQPNLPPPSQNQLCLPRPPATRKPTNPDPLPVKPVCEPYYEWNGRECYQILSNEPICPLGHNLTEYGQCVSILQALCQENYYPNGDFCVGLLETPIECPENYNWDGEKCVYQLLPSCPDGFVYNNGYCEKSEIGSCPVGTLMDNYRCIGHHQVEITCDYGHSWDGTYCVNSTNSCEEGFTLINSVCEKYIIESPDFECPPRTQMVGDQCISVELICPRGFTLIDLTCVEQKTSDNSTSFIIPNCTSGYQLVGCECVKIIENISVPGTPQCPPNYVLKDGLCYYDNAPIPSTCPVNYNLIDGVCVLIPPNDNALICPPGHKLINSVCVSEEPTETPSKCPDGHILINEICIPLPKCPQIDCRPNYTSSCACPVGYTLVNGLCVLITEGSNLCPLGYQWINGTCILTAQPGANICPPYYQWSDGICVHTVNPGFNVCPPNSQFINGICVIITPPGDSNCPPEYQWIDGKCVFKENEDVSTCPPGYQLTDGNCVPPTENPYFNPCPTGYQWINGTCVNAVNPTYCPTGYRWINGNCVYSTPVVPDQTDRPDQPQRPDQNDTLYPPDVPLNPVLPPILQPCYPNTQNPPCQPCPTYNPPCQPCPTDNGSNKPQPPSVQPPQSCPDCPKVNTNCPECQQVARNCADCPHVTHYITKDGHISITNIVNVAHHHQRPPNRNDIQILHNNYETSDYDTNFQNATDEADATEKCCEIITPRQCKRNGDEWTCFHRKYQRCGDICTQPKIYLKPKTIHYQPPILIMPPPPRRIHARRRMFSGGAVGKCNNNKEN